MCMSILGLYWQLSVMVTLLSLETLISKDGKFSVKITLLLLVIFVYSHIYRGDYLVGKVSVSNFERQSFLFAKQFQTPV